MKFNSLLRCGLLLGLLCGAPHLRAQVAPHLRAQQALPEFMTPRTDIRMRQTDSREKRVQAVKLNLDALRELKPGRTNRFTLRPFPDVKLTLELDEKQDVGLGGAVWRGRVANEEISKVLLSLVAGTAILQIETKEALYLIRPSAQGYRAVEVKPDIGAHCAGAVAEPHAKAPAAPGRDGQRYIRVQSIAVVDVLGYYTTIAKNSLGGDAGMQNQIQLSINQANDIMSTSQVGVTLNLLESRELPGFNEINDYSGMLSSFRDNASVRQRRDQLGADLVTLFVTNRESNGGGITNGIAYLYSNWVDSELGYSVVNYLDATTGAVFAHEIGHNFGCDHNDENAGDSSEPYARGWRHYEFPLYIRTVMAYDDGAGPILCYTYSSATRQYRIALTDYRIGDANHDNSRRILETKDAVAAYRDRASYLAVAYVDKNSVQPSEDGSALNPFKTLAKGITAVVPFGTLYVSGPGQYLENLDITKPLFLERWPDRPAPIIGSP
jgi:hypothetical protein